MPKHSQYFKRQEAHANWRGFYTAHKRSKHRLNMQGLRPRDKAASRAAISSRQKNQAPAFKVILESRWR